MRPGGGSFRNISSFAGKNRICTLYPYQPYHYTFSREIHWSTFTSVGKKLEDKKETNTDIIFELTEDNLGDIADIDVPIMVEISVPNVPPPIQQASELLGKIILSHKGVIRLARANVEKYPNIAGYFRISRVPTYFIIQNGNIGRPLVGPQTEMTFRKYINLSFEENHSDTVNELLTQADTFLEQNDIPKAAQQYNLVLTDNRYFFAHAPALAGLVLSALKEKNLETAQSLVNSLKSNYPDALEHPKVKQALTQLELQTLEDVSDVDVNSLLNRIKENPKDLQARYDLGVYYQRIGQYQNAIDEYLNIIKIDKEWNNKAAKEMLLKIFDSLGTEHQITLAGRRRLNNVWFC